MNLFSVIAISSLLAISYKSYQSSQTLDTHMSPEQEEDTGLNKLNPQEREALQNWINENHYVKPGVKPYKTKHPEVSEVLAGGNYLKLSDGTLWEVHPDDTPITSSWVTPANIKVVNVSGTSYTLTNQLTKSQVRATKIDQLPAYLTKPPAANTESPTKQEKKKEQEKLDKYFESPTPQPKEKRSRPKKKKPQKKYKFGP